MRYRAFLEEIEPYNIIRGIYKMNNNNLLTVKQVANELNISVQAVYKLINNKYKEYVTIVDGKKMLDDSIITAYLDIVKPLNQPIKQIDNELLNYLKEENNHLKDEVNYYKGKISDLERERNNLIEHLQELDNQLLQVINQQNVLILNTQQPKITDTAEQQNNEQQEPKKKGIFKRIFSKR